MRALPEPNYTITPWPEGGGHGFRLSLDQGDFGAGQLVFGLLADLVEQAGALSVVEEPGGQLLGLAVEPLLHQPLHVGGGGMQVDQVGLQG